MKDKSDSDVVFVQSSVTDKSDGSKAVFAKNFGQYVAKLLHQFERAARSEDYEERSFSAQNRCEVTPK